MMPFDGAKLIKTIGRYVTGQVPIPNLNSY